MRGLQILILVSCLGLVGTAVWQGRQWIPGEGFQTTSAATLPARPAASPEAKAVRHSAVKKSVRYSASSVTNEPTGYAFSPDLDSPKRIAAPSFSVPEVEGLAPGTTSSELRKRYGIPAFAVEFVHGGSLVERCYYLKPDRANMVVATLSNGKVVSAQNAQLWQPQKNLATQSAP